MASTGNPDGIKRQAVVVIHGIGEQRPMETLRNLVDALLPKDACKGRSYHSKPETITGSYELRRIKLRKFNDLNNDWLHETDFFEYYWAHQMSGNELSHILNWVRRLLTKPRGDDPSRINHRLGLVYGIVCTLFVLVLLTILVSAFYFRSWKATGSITILLGFIVKYLPRLLLGRVVNTIGDAARYLDVAPANVARRYDILRGGIEMLRKLHNPSGAFSDEDTVSYVYDRIVIIGHSLGSIIAYDLLKHYWAEVNGLLPVDPNEPALQEVESSACSPDAFSKAQFKLWKHINRQWLGKDEFNKNEVPKARWLVTDFITLGSPLSYGATLMADGDFVRKTELRELPTCPPDPSRHVNPGHFTVPLSEEASVKNFYDILHHGALFAVTRWTNLYFTKDLIAGTVNNVFGEGIREVKLTEGPNSWLRSHISYWKPKAKNSLDEISKILKNVYY